MKKYKFDCMSFFDGAHQACLAVHSALLHPDSQVAGSDTRAYLQTVLTPRLFRQTCRVSPAAAAAAAAGVTGSNSTIDSSDALSSEPQLRREEGQGEHHDPLLNPNPLQELINMRALQVVKSVCPKDRCLLHRVKGHLRAVTDDSKSSSKIPASQVPSNLTGVPNLAESLFVDTPTPASSSSSSVASVLPVVAVDPAAAAVVNSEATSGSVSGGDSTTPSTVAAADNRNCPKVITSAQVVMEVTDTLLLLPDMVLTPPDAATTAAAAAAASDSDVEGGTVTAPKQPPIEAARTSICVYTFETCLSDPDYEWRVAKIDFMIL